jgi:putative cardiolipin synthase
MKHPFTLSYKKLSLLSLLLFLSACTSLPVKDNYSPSYAFNNTSETTLGKKATHVLATSNSSTEILETNPKNLSKMYLLNEGVDAFFARMLLLSKAERSIDVQYFIWHDDLIGKLLLNEILKAANRGVRVRILQDDININLDIGRILYALDQHKNITVHLFNPFTTRYFRGYNFLSDGKRLNRRMHNKSFTVDNQATIVGGRNIGNEYFAADAENNFNDIDVLAVGPLVTDISKQFDLYWNSDVVYPVSDFSYNTATKEDLDEVKTELSNFKASIVNSKYANDLRNSSIYHDWTNMASRSGSKMLFSGEVKVVYDDPEKGLAIQKEGTVYLTALMQPYKDNVKKSFEVISPYFVPGKQGVKFLVGLVKKGVKVRVITNSLSSTDGVMAQSGYARHRVELLKGGVEIYEVKNDVKTKDEKKLKKSRNSNSSLHAKIYIFDRKEVFVGSFNFDQRSKLLNSELGVVYQIPEMADLIAQKSFDEETKEFTYRVKLAIEIDDQGITHQTDDVIWIENKNGQVIQYDTDPNTHFWRRWNETFFSILPIESQL